MIASRRTLRDERLVEYYKTDTETVVIIHQYHFTLPTLLDLETDCNKRQNT